MSTDAPDTRPMRQRRTPAVAFLVGALLIGLAALAVWLFWGSRAETPTTPAEAVLTDSEELPPPDTGSVAARVEEALAATPAAGAQPARQAAAEAQAAAPELAAEPETPPAQTAPATPTQRQP